MIPSATWLTLILDVIIQYHPVRLPASGEEAIRDLIREIQYDAKSTALEDIEQYVKKQQLKKE